MTNTSPNPPILPCIQAALRAARENAGLTLAELARRADIKSSASVSRFERGLEGWPAAEGGMDARVDGYARACDTTALALWTDALRRYEASLSKRRKMPA